MTVSASPRRPRGSVGPLDRAAAERLDADLLDRLRADASTRVVGVLGDRAPIAADGRLLAVAAGEVDGDGAEWAFLGRDADGRPVLLAALDPHGPEPWASPRGWQALRVVSAELAEDDTAVLVTAVALGRWLRDAAFCPACGARTRLCDAGWSRTCPGCGRQHFPRTDPAVIVAITREDDPDALLLGSNTLWGPDRYSCFAGFAEAGESLEDAVVREVREEAGITVARPEYVASQGWPYPRSLMLGFRAIATDPDAARGDGDEIADTRWFTRAEVGAALAGTGALRLPGPASIAHRLIREWCENPEAPR